MPRQQDPSRPSLARKPLTASDKAFRRACAIAVLNGVYAAHGNAILELDDAEYETAIRGVSRTAFKQADEMLRREGVTNG